MRQWTKSNKRRRRAKGRCRICRSDNGKRQCPALRGIMICPDCCKELRGKIKGCDNHCFFYSPLISTSKKLPVKKFPVYKCLVSKSKQTGMIIAVVARELPDGNLKVMFILLDLWKKGIRDCFVDANVPKDELEYRCTKVAKHYHIAKPIEEEEKEKEEKEEKKEEKTEEESKKEERKRKDEEFPFSEISFKELQKLVKYSYRIASEVKTEIPWDLSYWRDMLGDMSDVPVIGGSLYKCPKCGADLPEQVSDLMKQHAQSDDIHFYILCRKCGGQFE